MSEIAVISETSSSLIFKGMDIDCHIATEDKIEQTFQEVYSKGYKIIFVTETVYRKCNQYIQKEQLYPQVTPLRDITKLSKLAKIATGMELE